MADQQRPPDDLATEPTPSTAPSPAPAEREPVVPERAFDDTDAAWGDYPRDEDEWWQRQRPPHHGG